MKTWHIVVTAVVSVALSASLMWLVIAPKGASNERGGGPTGPTTAALLRPHAATMGNPAASVHVVEFLDPACETCRHFYPMVKGLLADDPDKLRLSMRLVAFHKGSDFVVNALEASKKAGHVLADARAHARLAVALGHPARRAPG